MVFANECKKAREIKNGLIINKLRKQVLNKIRNVLQKAIEKVYVIKGER